MAAFHTPYTARVFLPLYLFLARPWTKVYGMRCLGGTFRGARDRGATRAGLVRTTGHLSCGPGIIRWVRSRDRTQERSHSIVVRRCSVQIECAPASGVPPIFFPKYYGRVKP
ncbi:hypothetical protein BJ170DRAFT_628922 [Xylariales sp. AK1849]|nr:hypothetical protein BJ170DRAFT_628922 [Xylariales sp. AK1849]